MTRPAQVDSVHPNAVRLAFIHALPYATAAAIALVLLGMLIGVLL